MILIFMTRVPLSRELKKRGLYRADPSVSRFERPFGEWRDALFI